MSGVPINTDPPVAGPRCEEALRRVLQSQTFARSEKLQRFLKYVAEMTFRGDAGRVHEHLIAVEVFGRGDDYSPGEDSVVRRQAHALRRKLKDYYEGEGRLEDLQIDLPVGTYVPVFRERGAAIAGPPAEASVALESEPPASAAAGANRFPSGTAPGLTAVALVVCSLLAAIGLFSAGWALRGASTSAEARVQTADEAVRRLWAPWLNPNSGGAVLCFSNPPTTSVRRFESPLQPNPEHQGLAVSAEQEGELRRFFRFPGGGNIYLYPLAAQAKMGEALAAVSLTSFFTGAGVPVRAVQSRFINWETMRQENIILLGHADSNQWIEPVLKSAPFRLAPTGPERRARIVNPQPRPGEQAEYFPTIPDATKSYALVSMLAGLDGTHEILVLGGLDTSSTTAAADYMMMPDTARDLLGRLEKAAPGHRGPWRFQVILETDVRDTVPLKAFPVALRVL